MSPQFSSLNGLTPTEGDLDKKTKQNAAGQKLREKAAKALHGPDANPSQLGDPISLKAETSNNNPTPEEGGSQSSGFSYSASSSSTSGSTGYKRSQTLREKAVQKLHGPGANPSQLGDPISLKAETSRNVPTPRQGGVYGGWKGRQSRL